MDVSGEQQINVDHNIFKQRLDADLNVIEEAAPEKESKLQDSQVVPHMIESLNC